MATKFAIVNEVKTSHKVIAICELRTYDVWGNAADGYDVNNSFVCDRALEVPAVCSVSNLPCFPGAKDEFGRAFPADSASFTAPIVVSYHIEDKELSRVFDCTRIEVDGDDTHYYINRAKDGKPLGELFIHSWKLAE